MKKKMIKKVNNYIDGLNKSTTLRFIFELSLISFVLKLLFIPITVFANFVASKFLPEIPLAVQSYSGEDLIIIFLLVSPFIETFFGQLIPISLLSRFTENREKLIILSAIIFALIHLHPLYIIEIFPLGLVLSTAYIVKKQDSTKAAYFNTSLIHLLHNVYAIGLQTLLAGYIK